MAYGTQTGRVVVVVRHPENIGQAPQIFQCYHVHTCPILRVVLGEKHLISGEDTALQDEVVCERCIKPHHFTTAEATMYIRII